MQIAALKSGMRNVEVQGIVTAKGEARTVNFKAGGTGKVADATIGDDSGSISLSLWNEQIEKVTVGKRVKVSGGYVNTFKGQNSVAVGKFGKLEVLA